MSDTPTPIEQFMYWQCRIRQDSVRQLEGRPTPGMQPLVSLIGSEQSLGRINTLITKLDAPAFTSQFRHIVKKTQDPSARLKSGLRLLAEAYYQQPKGFSTEIKALFALDSELAGSLLDAGGCELRYAQQSQNHHLRCQVRDIPEADDGYQAIYWHNFMFNLRMPGKVRVLGFVPQLS